MKVIAVLLALAVCATAQQGKRASAILRYRGNEAGLSHLGRIMFNDPVDAVSVTAVSGNIKLAHGVYIVRVHQRVIEEIDENEPIDVDYVMPFDLCTVIVDSEGRHKIVLNAAYHPTTLTFGDQETSIVNQLVVLYAMTTEPFYTPNAVASGIVRREATAKLFFNNPSLTIGAGILKFIQMEKGVQMTGSLLEFPPGSYEIAINKRNSVTSLECWLSQHDQSPIILQEINITQKYIVVDEFIANWKFGFTNSQQAIDNFADHDISIYKNGDAQYNDITRRVVFGQAN